MKLISLLLILLSCSVLAYGQKGKILQASSYYTSGKLDQAKKLVDEGMKHDACSKYSKGYFIKGQIYQAIHESLSADYRKLDKNALEVALDAYRKLLELDKKGKYDKRLEVYFRNLITDFTTVGITHYKEQRYKEALAAFKRVLEVENSRVITKGRQPEIDTVIIFNAAVAAQKAGNRTEAEQFYKQALKYNYKLERSYAMLANVLLEQEKNDEAVECLHIGNALFPHNSYMLLALINYYMDSEHPEKADEYLDAALRDDPENALYYRTKGVLYEKLSRWKQAERAYEKALELNPEDFISQYNLANIKLAGVIHFRKKVLRFLDVNRYKEELEKLYDAYKNVIPYFERALELNPKDRNSILILRDLYFNLRNENAKYQSLYEQMKIRLEENE